MELAWWIITGITTAACIGWSVYCLQCWFFDDVCEFDPLWDFEDWKR